MEELIIKLKELNEQMREDSNYYWANHLEKIIEGYED